MSQGNENVELTHLIKDGWFHEKSPGMWPGQAMSLEVVKVLHTEQTPFQKLVVFQSSNHGRVLVLDDAIQCTERDEFSYQEMITHLPLNAHPNPENVLVIGGGDGGVLREVAKHPAVRNIVLCEIDEAVPRVSKEHLPYMAAGFDDKRVTVRIGDGFEYLKEQTGKFDVIITDSSDPNEGPAQELFTKSYLELLHSALRPKGIISSQVECIWNHLPLIYGVVKNGKDVFPVTEYAHFSVPTYPSGGIGVMICALDKAINLKKPLRTVHNTQYYNNDVHEAAFVLPEFARRCIAAAKANEPMPATPFDFALKKESTNEPTKNTTTDKSTKKILVLGSGFVAQPAIDYLLRQPANEMTIACRSLETSRALSTQLSRPVQCISLDVNDAQALEEAVSQHDLVISLIPYIHHTKVIKAAIKAKKNVVTTSYVSPAMRMLDAECKAANITVMNEIGLDPGVDHLYAVKTIDEVHQQGGKIKGFYSYCGGLPAPDNAPNPLGYQISWSCRGAFTAILNAAKIIANGSAKEIEGKDLMSYAKPYHISDEFSFVGYPNRDSTVYREFYAIPEADDIVRGTLRYAGFPEFIKVLVDLGFLSDSEREDIKVGSEPKTWKTLTASIIGASSTTEAALVEAIKKKTTFKSAEDEKRIISGLEWMGLLGDELIQPKGNVLDTFCATVEKKIQYQTGERDMVMLRHTFEVELKDGTRQTRTSSLLDFGAPTNTGKGPSAMAKLVGVPCGIAAQLVLDGVISKRGVLAPYTRDLVDPLLAAIEKEGITMEESVYDRD